MWRQRAQQRTTPVKREAVIAGLASEGLALILDSAEAGRSAVVGSMPTDPVEFVFSFFLSSYFPSRYNLKLAISAVLYSH